VSGKSLLKANVTYYITIGAGGAGGTGGNTAGTAGYDGAYSSFIDVSALGGIGGQEVNFTDKTTSGWNWVHVQLGGYRDWHGVNGNLRTRRRYSRGAGQGVDRIFEQFVLLRVRRRLVVLQPRGMSVLRTV
jgi:hypothetical protein